MSPAVRFVNVSRRFGSIRAVDGVTLDIAEGEFFAMLGPSGSGKTTCLRLIAGFEQPDEGHIEIFGETAEGVPPYKRNVNTVFQDYALFPHMTVGENVAYGLRIKGVARADHEARARDALAMFTLAGYEDRRPAQLNHGEGVSCLGLAVGPGNTLDPEAIGDILADRHVGKEGVVLEHGVDVAFVGRHPFGGFTEDLDMALVRLLEAGDEAQAGRLARARRTEHGEKFALHDVEGDAVDSPDRTEAARGVLEADRWRHGEAATVAARPLWTGPLPNGRATCRGWRCSPSPTASTVRTRPPFRTLRSACARTRFPRSCRSRWSRSPCPSAAHCPCRRRGPTEPNRTRMRGRP